ncbi:MAG: carboxypeptidase regulatory-like domain-containing protein [Deltaproteobacteria bacterium]|nr:carboxypeptidase regulatory-like domain-containing protein [Deltaproteobacteria bacterium]
MTSTHLVTRAGAALLIATTLSCREPTPENTSCDGDWYEQFLLPAPAELAGDVSCWTPGEEVADNVDPRCQTEASVEIQVTDYQDQVPVPGASVTLFADDSLQGQSREVAMDDDGIVTETVLLCTPTSYRATRPEGALPTTGVHEVFSPEDPVEAHFQSISEGSKSLLQLTFQKDIAPGNGAVAGRALGCDGEPLENAQVVVRDADCHVSTDAYTGYFTNQLPDLFRTSTSADGVFAVLNVPPGDYTVELFAPVPGRTAEDPQPHVRAGSATLTLEADGATVVDVQLGHDDGLFYPAACSSCP